MAKKMKSSKAAADTPGKEWMEDGDDAKFVSLKKRKKATTATAGLRKPTRKRVSKAQHKKYAKSK